MDSVQNTPTKRRKLANGQALGNQAYDSQNDSGDEIFDDFETVATLPVQSKPKQRHETIEPPSSPLPYITQPTQIIQQPTPKSPTRPSIQVAASSPTPKSDITSPAITKAHIASTNLAFSMAPAGTAFKPPIGVAKAPCIEPKVPAATEDESDDNLPVYIVSSDEESSGDKGDIKPSTFDVNAQSSFGSGAYKGGNRFREITKKALYNPIDKQATSLPTSIYNSRNCDEAQTTSRFPTQKQSSDVMASAYGAARRAQPAKQIKQSTQPKLLSAQDISLDEIENFQVRSKIQRMRNIFPYHSISACKRAMEVKKYSFEDAMEYLASSDGGLDQIDPTNSEGDGGGRDRSASQSQKQKKIPAKQQVKAPIKSIQQKWTATQPVQKRPQTSSSPSPANPLSADAPKPRRRLIQGRKRLSSPVAAPSPPEISSVHLISRATTPIDLDESDSALGDSEPENTELEGRVLEFFNTCSVPDLSDIASVSESIAMVLLSQKPFTSLGQIRELSGTGPTKDAKNKRKSTKKPIGDKIVDKCLDMWTGYEAVDLLVKQCENLGKPLQEDMKVWGVDVYGAAKSGELDLVNFERDTSPRDSGIGTPTMSISDDEGDVKALRRRGFFSQPSKMANSITLKDYQIVGVNWLALLFDRKLSCILADDMGLGKTCQVIAFLAHLMEKGIKGPHLIVVPASTLENWLREFSVFCPELNVMPYYAGQAERPGVQTQILDSLGTLNVIVTTYTLARTKDDNRFFRKLKPVVCVYDEGHYLKNSKSTLYGALMQIPTQFRILLTGTPLQNNLQELASLLGFILPSVFREHSDDLEHIFNNKAKTNDDSHAALLSKQRIARAKSMMTPFILRRKKHQVLKHLPAKTRRIEYCDLSESQTEIYETEKAKALRVVAARAAGEKVGNQTANVMMNLRKASIHPLLFRRLYRDDVIRKMSKACLKEDEFKESNVNLVYEDMEVMTDMELNRFCEDHPKTMKPYVLQGEPWMDSGKISKLADLLKQFKANGDRVLVFSQFVMVLDIIELVMEQLEMAFFRLDGKTKTDERQDMIDQFYKEEEITVFLLSTGAGGTGINLACANKVIIFDSSFNPQSDIQAENRAHRVGQKREVEVVKLVTRHTIEEQIHSLGETKLTLDDRVAGVLEDEVSNSKAENQGAKIMEGMMIGELEEELKAKKITKEGKRAEDKRLPHL